MKRKYLITKQPREGEQAWSVSGPFVVFARNPLHAARLTRHKWPAYLGNHISVETHALEVREYGLDTINMPVFVSDRRGLTLPSRARVLA